MIAVILSALLTFNTVSSGVAECIAETITAKNQSGHEAVYTQHGIVYIDKADIELCARLVWGEARGVKSQAEQAAVIWCALNRLDHGGYGDTLRKVVTARGQFTGYRRSNPVTEEFYELALDVLLRHEREKLGEADVGRTLPKEYKFFAGYGGRNWFRQEYRSSGRWSWELESPY